MNRSGGSADVAGEEFPLLDQQADVDALFERLALQPRYAIDTEFHRERTYFPQLALLQFASADEVALVDPLRVSLAGLRALFASDAVAVFHAAQQDLDVLTYAIDAVPARMYDTQLAAGFLGYSTPSLVNLLLGELRVEAAKGDRLTDWLRRPLSAAQRTYAAGDVTHLLALQDKIDAQLDKLGRGAWAAEACDELRCRPAGAPDPDQAWLRLKDVRILKAKSRGVAKAVASWREQRAMKQDSPVRQVLPDLAILGIAQRQPSTLKDLAQARGVDERHTRGAIATEILAAVERGLTLQADLPVGDSDDLERGMRPAVTLVSAWISDLARRQRVDTTLLATRTDIVAKLRGDAEARLSSGWRAELVGEGINRLVSGSAALTFDGRGGLRLVDVGPGVGSAAGTALGSDDLAQPLPELVEG